MNKIYRRLWSSARQCWVVTSELASPRGKAASTLRRGAAAAVVMLLALPAGAGGLDEDEVRWWQLQTLSAFMAPSAVAPITPRVLKVHRMDVYANTERANWSVVTGRESMALGPEAQAAGESSLAAGIRSRAEGDRSVTLGSLSEAWGNNSIAIGHYAVASGGGFGTAIGTYSKAEGVGATAVGQNAKARKENSIAVGSGAQTDGGAGNSRIAIGGDAYAGSDGYAGAIALGGGSRAERDGIAIGHGARVSAVGAVALGRDAVATETNTVSVGSAEKRRRVVNVADGRLNDDSFDAVNGRQLKVARDTAQRGVDDAAAAKARADSAAGSAQNARNIAERAMAASGLVTEVSPTGNMRVGAQNSGDQISFANRNNEARYLNGIRNGTLSSTSTDAVTGQQLFATHQRLDKIDGLVNQTAQNGSIRIGSANTGGALTISNKDGELRYLNGVRNGTISATSHDAVTGQQLFAVNQKLDPLGRTIAAGAGIADADRADASGTGALAIGGKAVAKATHATALGYDAQATANQATAMGRQSRATGTFSTAVGNNAQASAESALALGDRAEAGHDRSVALGRQSVTTGSDQVSVGNAGLGLKRKIVNMEDGALNATSTDAVTGKQLFATNEKVDAGETLLAVHSGDLAAHSGRIADNRRDLDSLRAEFEDFDPDLEGVVKFSPDGSVDVAGGKLRNVTAGDISSAASMDAVNGGQLFAANQRIAGLESGKRFIAISSDDESENALAARFSMAIGDGAKAGGDTAEGATAVGFYATALASNSVALGSSSLVRADAEYGFALGATAEVRSRQGLALGAGALVLEGAEGSIALGSDSIVRVKNVVSVGSEGNRRRIINVAQGQDANDATTVAQLDGALRQLGGGAHLEGGNVVAPRYNVQGSTQNNVGDALAALDSAVVATDSRMDGLEGKLRSAFRDGPSVRADGLNHLALAGANGAVLTNLADGRIAAGSRDAVTGSQLFEAKQEIARNRSDVDDLRGERNELLSRGLMAAEQGNVIDFGGARLTGVADGVISADSRDVVNGRQLFALSVGISELEGQRRFFKFGYDELSADAQAGILAVAIGDSAQASIGNEGGTAVGSFSKALAINSVALGRAAFVSESATNGFSLGAGSRVEAEGGVALGSASRVDGRNSVAIGHGSRATEAGVVSFGGDIITRRLTRISRGTADSDAVTVSQVKEIAAALGGGSRLDGDGGLIAPAYNVQGGTQHNFGDALTALDGAVVKAESRVNSLEGELRSVFQDSPTVRNDGLNQLALAGAHGSVLTNLADGRIAAGSRDAVTGSQLFEARQEIDRNRSDLDDLRVERDELLSHGLMAAGQGNVIDYGGARLTGVADGAISADSRDVVNGRQLFASNQRIAGLESGKRFIAISSDDESVNAMLGGFSTAIGDGARAGGVTAEGATAVGFYATALAGNSVALGSSSYVHADAEYGFALGATSEVRSRHGMALGARAIVLEGAEGSVALGDGSTVRVANAVSVGSDDRQRRIINVANGRNATDVATVGQLRGALSTLGGDIDANGNIINPTFNVQGGQQSTLTEALSTLDSAVVTSGNRVDRVESQLNAVFQNTPTVRNDGLNQLTFAGPNGMVLSNVANGVVAAGSRDAVNGGQLHSMQQQLNGRMDGLEHRIDGQPQSRALATVAGDEPTAPTPPATAGDKALADNGNAPKSTPQPQADAPKPESPAPQVDTAELEKMLARANEYSDGISREVDRRLDKMDKRFNRMAAMTSAQSAMAMNTAGLNTYNRLGAGVGYSEGESAMAVGYQRVLNDKGSATFSLNGAFTNSGERSMGVGVGIGW